MIHTIRTTKVFRDKSCQTIPWKSYCLEKGKMTHFFLLFSANILKTMIEILLKFIVLERQNSTRCAIQAPGSLLLYNLIGRLSMIRRCMKEHKYCQSTPKGDKPYLWLHMFKPCKHIS